MNDLVPIVRINKKNEWWVEHLWIVKVSENVTIGISLQLNIKTHNIEVTGIHLNKEFITKSRTLIPPHNCHCLDAFMSLYDDLKIGDIDEDKNTNKQLKRHLTQYKSNYYKLKKLVTEIANTPPNTSIDAVRMKATQLLNSITSPVSDRHTVATISPQTTTSNKAFQFQGNQLQICSHTPISQQPNDSSINRFSMGALSLPLPCMSINSQTTTQLSHLLCTGSQLPYSMSYNMNSPITIPVQLLQQASVMSGQFPSPTLTPNSMNIPYSHVPFILKNNKKHVYIGKDLTNKYFTEIKQLFGNTKELFYYLGHSIMMQINDRFARIYFGNLVIVNCDLCDKLGNDLYVIMQPYNNETNKNKYDWQVVQLCDVKQIAHVYHISKDQLPFSSRKLQMFQIKLNIHCNINITHSDINRINFKSIKPIKSKLYKGLNNKQRKIINCSQVQIRTWIITALNNIMPIPIIRIKDQKHWIESVIICMIPRENVNFGVSFVVNDNNVIEATCIFLDKMDIVNQNKLIGQTIVCEVLDKFVSGIAKMTIT